MSMQSRPTMMLQNTFKMCRFNLLLGINQEQIESMLIWIKRICRIQSSILKRNKFKNRRTIKATQASINLELKIIPLSGYYGLSKDSIINITEMTADQNRVFKIDYIDHEPQSTMMRICETRSLDQISMNLEMINELSNDNIPCPKPIRL